MAGESSMTPDNTEKELISGMISGTILNLVHGYFGYHWTTSGHRKRTVCASRGALFGEAGVRKFASVGAWFGTTPDEILGDAIPMIIIDWAIFL